MKLFRNLKADKLTQQLVTLRDHEQPDAVKAIEKLAGLGDAAVPKVIEALALADKSQMITFVDLLNRLLNPRTVDLYIAALTHESARVVAGVGWALGNQKNYDPNKLLDLLGDDRVPKAKLFEIIAARKDKVDIRRLLRAAYDLPESEKAQCMRLVADNVDDSLLPELIERVDGKDPVIRSHIIGMLARFKGREVQHALQQQLNDRSKLIRQAALSALARMGANIDIETLIQLLADADIDVQNKAVDVLVRLNHPDTVRHLVSALQDENEYTRRAAVEVLNEIGNPDAIKDLLTVLQDSDWWVRSRATDALAKIGGPRVVDAVLELINDDDEHVRRSAIEILNSTKSDRAVNYLIDATRDPDWWVRERAVDALADMGAKQAVPALREMLNGHPKSVPAALRGLAVLGDTKVITDVLPLLQRREKDIQIEAAETLVRLASNTRAQSIVDALSAQASSEDPQVQKAIRRALEEMDSRFSATAIQRNALADKLAEPSHTMLVETAPEAIAKAATTSPTLDLNQLQPGQIIENRYKYIQQIGKGAFGTVILVEDTVVDERLVLKFLNTNISSDSEMMQRFVHELRYSRKITHKNVIRIYDFLHLGGLYAISMEYFPSHTLGGEIKNKQPLDTQLALRISRDIANGMAVAHQVGIVHRDLKPANVLIDNDGLVKVVDFGVASAHSAGDTQLTKTGYVIGSPKYMAPEQILGKKVDERADIYSLGIIMYELLTGSPPYTEGDHMAVMYQHVQGNAKPISEANPALSPEVCALVNGVIAVDKVDRYQSMDDLRRAIEPLLND